MLVYYLDLHQPLGVVLDRQHAAQRQLAATIRFDADVDERVRGVLALTVVAAVRCGWIRWADSF